MSSIDHDPSQFFEKFVGELFVELGCTVESQPRINGGFSDYLATTPDGKSLYIEATVLTPKQVSNVRPAEEDVCKKLDAICRTPFLYWFVASASGELYRYLPKSELDPIKNWMEGLSADELNHQIAGFSFPSGTPPTDADAPSKDWRIEITAIPRSEGRRGCPDRLLAGFGRGGSVDRASHLVRAARAKGKQHKTVERPLVLAINDMGDFPSERIDVSLALFGWEQSAETGISRITPPREDLRRRSIWGKQENTRISGVLLFHRLWPGRTQAAEVCLYGNPWASYPIPIWLEKALPYAQVTDQDGIQHLHWPVDERLISVLQ